MGSKEANKEEIKQIRFKDLHLSLKVPIVVSYIVIILWILGVVAGLTT